MYDMKAIRIHWLLPSFCFRWYWQHESEQPRSAADC